MIKTPAPSPLLAVHVGNGRWIRAVHHRGVFMMGHAKNVGSFQRIFENYILQRMLAAILPTLFYF